MSRLNLLPSRIRWSLRVFRRLQWKLTLAYTFSTVLTALILAGIGLALLWYINFQSNWLPSLIADGLNKGVAGLAPYLEQAPPNEEGLENWLKSVTQGGYLIIHLPDEETAVEDDTMPAQFGRVRLIAIVDSAGTVVAMTPAAASAPESALELMRPPRRETTISTAQVVVPGVPLRPQLTATSGDIFQAALRGETDPALLSGRDPEGNLVASVPIISDSGRIVGAIFVKLMFPIEQSEYLKTAVQRLILPISLAMGISGAIAGGLLGYLIARGLVGRLRTLARAADDWSQGNFDTLARDNSGDELGQLARHLNHMAVELQGMIETRQELATLEERNRLARELHDSVKQQVFATAMQVGAARALIDQDPTASKENLTEAEQLVRQAQQELTTLIRELRPAGLEGKGLATALRDCVSDWSRQSHIAAEVRVRGERPLPLPLEQALFRVAQEALTNISRHSGATAVGVDLVWSDNEILLDISDNGQGFNPAARDGKGLGLQSMRERVEALGGRLEVSSTPGRGTRVVAYLKNIQ